MRSWSFSFLTLLLSLLAATLWVGTIVYHKVYDSNSDDDIEELENVVLQKLYQGTMKSEWRNITLTRQEEREITKEREKKEAEIWLTHLLVPTNFDETKPNLILMHGYGATSALTWRVTIPGLVDKFNVFAIDMPGFGRTPAPQSLLSIQDPVEAHQKYCSFYQSALESFHLNSKPFLIAHSFGGFVMTQCLAEHPHLFHGAILIAVPGFFSSNGPWGYVCATYFTFGLPQYPIQLLGDWMHYLYDMLSLLTNVQIDYSFVRYWHLVHMSPDMIPDVIVKKFIFHNGLYSMGIGISLLPLIKLTHQHHNQATPQAEPFPVAIVFGEKDFITPPQQGQVISELSGIRSYVIPGANHVAYTHNGGQDFLQVSPPSISPSVPCLLSISVSSLLGRPADLS
jgi:pimeloyl-ACP methyl ester carboxylesterase